MRGKEKITQKYGQVLRITPAYAGKSAAVHRSGHRQRDHPRVCGEKSPWKSRVAVWLGSPPRMRGKERAHQKRTPAARITPAYAGKSRKEKNYDQRKRDHPRVCGEKVAGKLARQVVEGSPPRMRGKERVEVQRWSRIRITPAYAGKRLLRPWLPPLYRDHPRVCGEKTKKIP